MLPVGPIGGADGRGGALRRRGFTIVELAVALAIAALFVGLGAVSMRDSLADARARRGARALADLLDLARTEAIRTGVPHALFFELDAEGNALTGVHGDPAAALLIRDADGDGEVDAGEKVASLAIDATRSLAWGSTFAANLATPTRAPDDNPDAEFPEPDPDFVCCTFLEPDGDPARWVLFAADGTPRAFQRAPFARGAVASGNGGLYVTSGHRDYSVVLAPLGGVRLHAFSIPEGAWTP